MQTQAGGMLGIGGSWGKLKITGTGTDTACCQSRSFQFCYGKIGQVKTNEETGQMECFEKCRAGYLFHGEEKVAEWFE